MEQSHSFEAAEMKRVIAAVTVEFYAHAAPAGAGGRLARLHQTAWDAVLVGFGAEGAFAELRRQASRLFNAEQMIEDCNRRVVWALTPVVAASMACAPGEGYVSLRDVGATLQQLLASVLREANQAPHRAAA